MKYEIGQKVRAIKPVGDLNKTGVVGVIKEINDDDENLPYLVEFEEDIDGHSNGGCKPNHGWWCSEYELELVEENDWLSTCAVCGRSMPYDGRGNCICPQRTADGRWNEELLESASIAQVHAYTMSEPERFIKPKKNIMSSIIETTKKIALKATNPDEYLLREAGIHDSDGDLTSEGRELLFSILEQQAEVKAKLVELAGNIIAERKEDK